MSSKKISELRHDLGAAIQAQQSAVDDFDATVAVQLRVNRTDLRCLEILLGRDGATPRELADELGLTSGSVTAMLDRLSKQDYLTRAPDPNDRRKLVIRATDTVRRLTRRIWEPLLTDANAMIDDYSADELRLIIDFLTRNRDLQQRHTDRVRNLGQPTRD
ncbi:MarR family winged helix-turn-helix transcriptional regulator [Stackebrandtia soli]|uniref:MarR family winged helix-turn-helix transcriptional regulator n=1 Tax=Stackebrandtia soli TaxID=1892856 RepID=UPI0039ED9034